MTKQTSTPLSLRRLVLQRIIDQPRNVWTPGDFADLASRDAVDKTLQRLTNTHDLRRIERGLYDRPQSNSLTGKDRVPDYRAIIEAIARRDKVRFVVDGMTAANQLGLTTAVPAKIEVLVDARLKPVTFGNQTIMFKYAAPSRLYWAGRPAMYVVQALHWMQDVMTDDFEKSKVRETIEKLFSQPEKGAELAKDLQEGLSALPIWMQEFLREPLAQYTKEGRL